MASTPNPLHKERGQDRRATERRQPDDRQADRRTTGERRGVAVPADNPDAPPADPPVTDIPVDTPTETPEGAQPQPDTTPEPPRSRFMRGRWVRNAN